MRENKQYFLIEMEFMLINVSKNQQNWQFPIEKIKYHDCKSKHLKQHNFNFKKIPVFRK